MICNPDQLLYKYHPDFDDPKAVEQILNYEFDPINHTKRLKTIIRYEFLDSDRILLPQYEQILFKQLNLLKKLANENPTDYEQYKVKIDKLKSIIVSHNVRLVGKMFVYVHGPDQDKMIEHISDGALALYKAVDRFDVSFNVKFSTYACVSILRVLKHKPSRLKYTNDFSGCVDDSSCLTELAIELEHAETVIKDLFSSGVINQREREMIELRYGFGDNEEHTLVSIAEAYGVTKERARQIIVAAFKKAQEYLLSKGDKYGYQDK